MSRSSFGGGRSFGGGSGGRSSGGGSRSSFGGGTRPSGGGMSRPSSGGMSRPSSPAPSRHSSQSPSHHPSSISSRPMSPSPSRPSMGPSRSPAPRKAPHLARRVGPPLRTARYNRYARSPRRNYRYRYYPHRRYYHVHGYRGAYYGTNFSGFLASVGIFLLLIGIVIGLEPETGIFNIFTILGAVMIVVGILLATVFSSRMGRMRQQCGDMGDPYAESSYNQGPTPVSAGNVGGTVNNTPPQQRMGTCPRCGASGNGNNCQYCGAGMIYMQ